MMKPCLICGEVSQQTRCEEHRPRGRQERRDLVKGPWIRLSRRARKEQPFCLLCGSSDNLQADHSPRAWARTGARLPIRLCDVSVLCGLCNTRAGTSKPPSARYDRWEATDGDLSACTPDATLDPRGRQIATSQALGGIPGVGGPQLSGETNFPTHTPGGYSWQV